MIYNKHMGCFMDKFMVIKWMKKTLLALVIGGVVSISHADDAGHWGGGYVSAHPDAFHQHQGYLFQDSYARNWYRHNYYPNKYHRHNCQYVKSNKHSRVIRRCYY